MFRLIRSLLAPVFLLPAIGCSSFEYPLIDPADAVSEDRLLGSWCVGGDRYEVSALSREVLGGPAYVATPNERAAVSGPLPMWVGSLGEAPYLTIGGPKDADSEQGAHLFFKLRFSDVGLTLVDPGLEWVSGQAEDRGEVETDGYAVSISTPTTDLQRLVMQYESLHPSERGGQPDALGVTRPAEEGCPKPPPTRGEHWTVPRTTEAGGHAVVGGRDVSIWPTEDQVIEVDRVRPVIRLYWERRPGSQPGPDDEVQDLRAAVTGTFGSVFSFSGRWRYTGGGRITEGLAGGDTSGALVVELDELPDDGERDLVVYLVSSVDGAAPVSNLLRLRVRILDDGDR